MEPPERWELESFCRRIPKVELHCHLEGAVRPSTLAELARANGIDLPAATPDELYRYDDLEGFLEIFELVCRTLVRRTDFTRVVYESLEDAVRSGNLRYREMFFDPTLHTRYGVTYRDVLDGLLEGIRAAESDFGVRTRLIPAVYRQDSVRTAARMLEEILEERRDEVIGIGMDGDELTAPPEKFADVFRKAAEEGLRRTAHAGHDAPPSSVTTSLDLLGCERIDHGYHVLDDPAVVARVRDQRVPFTTSLGCPPLCGWPAELERTPIKPMMDEGLWVSIHTDDPAMLHTDPGTEYVRFCSTFDYGVREVRDLALAALEMAWLDDDEMRSMRTAFEREIDDLERELGETLSPPGDVR
jgi:adenosine deaminase